MKRTLYIAVAMLLIAAATFGQAAEKIDKILETEAATFGQAAYLIQTALDDGSDGLDFETAFERFKSENQNLIRDSVTAEDVIPVKTYAFLLMKAFDVKGGMMYRIYPCPRYAYRDLRYLAVIQGKNNPDASMTGASMLQILGRVGMVQGGE
ncbi:hypothetical protein ABK01_08030 [Treponema sp. OMZ 305]|uniref:hypothetical protein n=1 Tax=Treponema TaxID=157 RepID=UPI001BAF0B50|nr:MULTISPECIES: hypothetical protein [Treponema]QUY18017.1 hypothetical protein GWP40_06480 [Treponema vincentii]UTC58213.1 hypothetical protein ABK01_08030 [Treponema sp. OMZ 305]